MANGWYTEVWAPDGVAAREHATYSDFKSARDRLDEFKAKNSGDIFRVLAPSSATPEEIRQLKERGAQLF